MSHGIKRKRKIRAAAPAARSVESRLGLYIHTPFCRKKCDYCDFYSLPCGAAEQFSRTAARYTAALEKHITETSGNTNAPVDTIYFGGGTPTVLGAKTLRRILKHIKRKFRVLRTAEITVEANPESADYKTLRKLRRAGFNRLSLGVQSLSDYELGLLGRIHDSAGAKRAFDDARRAGFDNISVDLMFGIEAQTPASWKKTLENIISWQPDHISCYALKVEEGTPLAARLATTELVDDDAQAELYLTACEILRSAGYMHYEISNWALPRHESRHNLRYWRIEPYIGFGPGASSDCFGARYSNVRDLESYMRGIELGGAVLDEYEDISWRERASEYVMLSLRTTDGVDLDNLSRRFDASTDKARDFLRTMTQNGLAVYAGTGRWRLSEKGWLLSNSIILEVIDAMSAGKRGM